MICSRKQLVDLGDGYKMYEAIYSIHPRIHEMHFEKLSNGVVTLLHGQKVAVNCATFTWTHPEHRGRGIYTKMDVHTFMNTWPDGRNWRCTEESRKAHGSIQLTEGPLAGQRRAFQELVRRGFIDPCGTEPPEKF